MEHRKQPVINGTIERRYVSDGMEFRAAENGNGGTLRGYALRFGSVYEMGDNWTEEVSRDAFKNADMADVRVLLNHDPNQILGRTSAGTARIGLDDHGLWYEVQLPDSPNGQNARVAVQRGDISQSSWGFLLNDNGDQWEKRDGGRYHRTLTDVRVVYDTSPVTFPANPDTTIAKRSLEAFTAAQGPTPEQIEQKKQAEQFEIELDLALMERQRHNHIIKTQK